MKKIIFFIAIVITILCTAIYFLLKNYSESLFNAYLEETDVNKNISTNFIIYGNSSTTISAKFWFYNLNRKPIATIERSWQGNILDIDFLCITMNDKTIYFPYSIRHDSTSLHKKKKGILLKDYLSTENAFLTFEGSNTTEKARKDILELYHLGLFIKSFNIFNVKAYIKTIPLQNCISNTTYYISTYTDGRINLLQEHN